MITDIQGFSQKSATSSREALLELIKTHNNLLKPIIGFYHGKIVKAMGDSFLCTFESATDAAVAATAIQMTVVEYNKQQRNEDLLLNIRIMICSGDVSIEKGDVFGEAVNTVSRMEKMPEFAQGGIGISESTYLLVNRQEILAESLGEQQFKGIGHPIKVYRLSLDKQKLTQLPTKLLDLVRQVTTNSDLTLDTGFLVRPPGAVKSPKRYKSIVFYSLAAIVFVFVALSIVKMLGEQKRMQMQSPSQRYSQGEILDMIRVSDPQRVAQIPKSAFQGPETVFQLLDTNRNDVLDKDEIRFWIQNNTIGAGRNRPDPHGMNQEVMPSDN